MPQLWHGGRERGRGKRRGGGAVTGQRPTMEIGWPSNVRHVAHVTFDRFHGFLGLPVELEPEVPRRALSASANVFGVSVESMQCSYDPRGNSVPTILLLMQRCLYLQGGLQAEGIFRINPENSQKEHVRDQLNSGIIPDGIDVHCLAGLIKAWFRKLPTGVLDSLTPQQVMQCQTEEACAQLVKLLPPTEAALLDWAVNLMADVVQEEHHNKMNAHNVAMVFAPNMIQMADPLIALAHVVQVMNLLKTLILKTLGERHESVLEEASASHSEPSDDSEHQNPPKEEEIKHVFVPDESRLQDTYLFFEDNSRKDGHQQAISEVTDSSSNEQPCELLRSADSPTMVELNYQRTTLRQTCSFGSKNGLKKVNEQSVVHVSILAEKPKDVGIMSHIISKIELVQPWWW